MKMILKIVLFSKMKSKRRQFLQMFCKKILGAIRLLLLSTYTWANWISSDFLRAPETSYCANYSWICISRRNSCSCLLSDIRHSSYQKMKACRISSVMYRVYKFCAWWYKLVEWSWLQLIYYAICLPYSHNFRWMNEV